MDIYLPGQVDNIIRTREFDAPWDKHGLAQLLFHAAKQHTSKIAQINAVTGQCYTHKELLCKSISAAIKMKSLGIKPDDIVCFCSENQLDVYVAYFATILVGAVVSALDPSQSKPDMKHLLSQVPPKIMFVTPKCEELIEGVLASINLTPDLVIFGQTDRNVPFDQFVVACGFEEEEAFKPHQVNDVFKTAIICFSSGTTGLPKGICINHYTLMNNGFFIPTVTENLSVYLGFSSIYWISSSIMFIGSILCGTTMLLIQEFDTAIENLWIYINRYKVNFLYCCPSQAASMQKYGIPHNLSMTSLKILMVGGSKVKVELLDGLRSKLPDTSIEQCYGMTETGGPAIICRDIMAKPTSTGMGRLGIWFKIVDPVTDEILGPNQPGELRLKTKLQMNGYYKLDSSSAWDEDGWLRTGDIFHYDEDYFFYFGDRLKTIIKYKGIHVQSTVLEDILLLHAAVEEVVVIGLPHHEDEEHPMAVVVLAADAGNVTTEELRRYVDERVDNPKRLRGGVRIVDILPKTPTGKVNPRALKDRFANK